jgi:hypothetical protein
MWHYGARRRPQRIDVTFNNDFFKPPENFAVLICTGEPPQRSTNMVIDSFNPWLGAFKHYVQML